MSAVLALLSSVLWGSADFLGGTASRRLPVLAVVGFSQLIALVLLLPLALVLGAFDAPRGYLVPGILAGCFGLSALAAFYRALAVGTMGVVAPIASLGVVVPVVFGLLQGERLALLVSVGIVVAVLGVVLASGPEMRGSAGTGGRTALLLATYAAFAFGIVLALIAEGSETTGSSVDAVVMNLVTMRATAVVVLGALLVVRRGRSSGVRPGREDVLLLVVIGVADVGANGTYAFATQQGLVSVASVLASLYPVVTALLAWRVHGERLTRTQTVGVALALGGVGLIAGYSG